MAGMQRFVTYIYAYENGKKQQNTGFAKIEVRGNDGRLELHLRGAGIRKGEGRAAFFTEKNGVILCFPVGKMRLVNGQGDFGTIFKADSIGHSPFGFANMEGIVITAEEGSILLSRWMEGNPIAVVPDNIRQWESEEEAESKADGEAESGAQKSAEKQSEKETENEEGNGQREAGFHMQGKTVNPLKEMKEKDSEEKKEEEKKAEDTLEIGMADSVQETQEHLESKEEPPKEVNESQNNIPAMTQKRRMSAKQEEQQLEEEGVLKMRRPESEETEDGDTEEDLQATEVPMRNIFPRYNWLEIWENIKETHPAFRLDGRNVVCVRIELKDLRDMPKKYWYLGNNSFLLHGFFNYRYLILGKFEEDRWFIGVPGIYQHQERVMAAIFGFPEFLPINRERETDAKRRAEEPLNQFGCWYHTLEE